MPELNDKPDPNPNRRGPQIGVRFSPKELELIKAMAREYSKGKLSVWIRQAALRFKPTKDDLIP